MSSTVSAQRDDTELAQALVGTWEWWDDSTGVPATNQLTLAGDGTYTYTTAVQNDQVTTTGVWYYEDGWLQFKTQWSSSVDPTGQPIGQGPIQVLEIGPDYVRTPAGLVRRAD